MSRPRALVTIMFVRNEADIIAHAIDHHLAHAVDHMLVADNGSTDETLDILRDYEKRGVLTLERDPSPHYPQAERMTRLLRRAQAEMGADAVICADADEFFVPSAGDLKDVFNRHWASVIRVRTRNLVPVDPDDADLPLHARTFVAVARPRSDGAWIYRASKPKVMVRPERVRAIDMGNHDAQVDPFTRRVSGRGVEVLHVPIRSYRQFERKVRIGAAALVANPRYTPSIGSHWRRWLELYHAGHLRDEFERLVIRTETERLAGIASGLVTDTVSMPWLTAVVPGDGR